MSNGFEVSRPPGYRGRWHGGQAQGGARRGRGTPGRGQRGGQQPGLQPPPDCRERPEFSAQHVVRVGNAEDRAEVSKKYIAEMQDFIREHADAIMLLIMSRSFEDGEVNGIDKVAGLHRYFENTSEIVSKRVVGQPRIDPRLMACISFSAILSCEIFADWLFPKGWGSKQEIHEAVADFVLGGFRAGIDEG